MAISFVAASSMWSSTATSTSFTLNVPAGTASGDFMVAVLAWSTGSTVADLSVATAPSGWTVQNDVYNGGDGFDGQLAILTKFATGSEPSSYSGSLGASSAKIKVSTVAAYRGVQGLLTKGTSSTAYPTTSYSTATVNNTVANSWRIVAGMYESASLAYSLNTNEVTSRALVGDGNSGSGDYVQVRVADSGAAIATGNTSRTFSRSQTFDASCAWIGILQETAGTPASGTLAQTLSGVTLAVAGEVHNDGTLAQSLSGVSMDFAGFGAPPDITGTFAQSLGGVSVDVTAALPPSGTLDMAILPNVQFSTETRVFGNRVITVEADDRRIVVPSRGVDG